MVGQVEQFIRKPIEDVELSQMDRDIIGGDVRITVPIVGRYQMRHVADLLRGYCARIDFLTHNHDLDDRTVLFNLKYEAKMLTKRIKQVSESARKFK